MNPVFEMENGVLRSYHGTEEVVTVPEHVTEIGDCAFADHDEICQVVLPSGLLRIGVDAFSFCTKLREVQLPEGLQLVDRRAFSFCYALRQVEIPGSVQAVGSEAFLDSGLSYATLHEGVQMLGDQAFYACGSLKLLRLPNSLKKICPSALEDCPNMAIVAEEESFAHAYATHFHIPFVRKEEPKAALTRTECLDFIDYLVAHPEQHEPYYHLVQPSAFRGWEAKSEEELQKALLHLAQNDGAFAAYARLPKAYFGPERQNVNQKYASDIIYIEDLQEALTACLPEEEKRRKLISLVQSGSYRHTYRHHKPEALPENLHLFAMGNVHPLPKRSLWVQLFYGAYQEWMKGKKKEAKQPMVRQQWYDILVENRFLSAFRGENPEAILDTYRLMVWGMHDFLQREPTNKSEWNLREELEKEYFSGMAFCLIHPPKAKTDFCRLLRTSDKKEPEQMSCEELAVRIIYPFLERMGGSFEEEALADGRLLRWMGALKAKIPPRKPDSRFRKSRFFYLLSRTLYDAGTKLRYLKWRLQNPSDV